MNDVTIKTETAPMSGFTHEEIERLVECGHIPNPERPYSSTRPLTIVALADFARENGLAMYRDGVQIASLSSFLPPPPAPDDLEMDETLGDEWHFTLTIEERNAQGHEILSWDATQKGQTVLGFDWWSPWNAVSPPWDAEYWLARHIWAVEDTGDPNNVRLRYGNTKMTYTASAEENWHPPYPSTKCTYIVTEAYTDFDGKEHDNSIEEIPEYETKAEAQKTAKSFCEGHLSDYLNTEDWSPDEFCRSSHPSGESTCDQLRAELKRDRLKRAKLKADKQQQIRKNKTSMQYCA